MEIVKYHNNLNNIKLGTLTPKELDIFIAIVYKMQEMGTREVTLPFLELKQLTNARVRNDDRIIKSVHTMSNKFIALNSVVETEDNIRFVLLFEMLDIDKKNKCYTIKITETFKYMLNDLQKDFTYYHLKEYISLTSKYSKMVYKFLRQYRANSWWKVELETFKEIMAVPPSYDTTNFNKKVLAPIEKELLGIFKNLTITKLTVGGKVARGRSKTKWLKFEWDKVASNRKSLKENIQAKQDKEVKQANDKAKKRIQKTEEQYLNKEVVKISIDDKIKLEKDKLREKYKDDLELRAYINNIKDETDLERFNIFVQAKNI